MRVRNFSDMQDYDEKPWEIRDCKSSKRVQKLITWAPGFSNLACWKPEKREPWATNRVAAGQSLRWPQLNEIQQTNHVFIQDLYGGVLKYPQSHGFQY